MGHNAAGIVSRILHLGCTPQTSRFVSNLVYILPSSPLSSPPHSFFPSHFHPFHLLHFHSHLHSPLTKPASGCKLPQRDPRWREPRPPTHCVYFDPEIMANVYNFPLSWREKNAHFYPYYKVLLEYRVPAKIHVRPKPFNFFYLGKSWSGPQIELTPWAGKVVGVRIPGQGENRRSWYTVFKN